MPVKTITLTVEAYNALSAVRDEGESFSAVVRRLAGSQVRLSDFAGDWKAAPRSELTKIRRFLEKSDSLSAEKQLRLSRRHWKG